MPLIIFKSGTIFSSPNYPSYFFLQYFPSYLIINDLIIQFHLETACAAWDSDALDGRLRVELQHVLLQELEFHVVAS